MNELKYEKIEGDLYGIVGRLKEIDPDYFLLRERKSGRVELHCRSQRGSTLCVVLPYKRLDARAVEYVRRTRRERAEQLLEEMNRENARLEIEEAYKARKKAERSLSTLL